MISHSDTTHQCEDMSITLCLRLCETTGLAGCSRKSENLRQDVHPSEWHKAHLPRDQLKRIGVTKHATWVGVSVGSIHEVHLSCRDGIVQSHQ